MSQRIQFGAFRSRRNAVFALLSETAGPFLSLYARRAGAFPPTPPSRWRRGLLLGAGHIGDLLYRTPSLPALASGLPDCKWEWLAPKGPDEVLSGNPHIARILNADIEEAGTRAQWTELSRLIRARNYDVAVCYDVGGYWRPLKLCVDAGIQNRVAYANKGFSAWVTSPIPATGPAAYPECFRHMVSALTGLLPAWPPKPLVYLSDSDRGQAEDCWRRLNIPQQARVLACFVTTRQPSATWPLDHFCSTLRALQETAGVRVLLAGGPSDLHVLTGLARRLASPVSVVAGELNLRALCHLLSFCSAALTTDSGPRHLANAAGIDVFFHRNLAFRKLEAGAYLASEYDLSPDAECLPLREQESVLRSVAAETVTAVIAERLGRTHPHGRPHEGRPA